MISESSQSISATPVNPHSSEPRDVVELLPGERILSELDVSAQDKIREPARWRRPKVFRGIKEKHPRPPRPPRKKPTIWTAWRWFLAITDPVRALIGRFVDSFMDYTIERCVYNPLCRAVYRIRDGNPLVSRRRGTIAYDLLCALRPRTRVVLLTNLEYTSQRLRYVYRRRNHNVEDGPRPMQVGWSMPLNHLSWIRRRKSPKRWRSTDCTYLPYEFGFADGSWITLEMCFISEDQELRDFLSHLSSQVHLSPEEKPTKALAKSLRKEWDAYSQK